MKNNGLVVNSFTNSLDIFEREIPEYKYFDSYIHKWIYYRQTEKVLYEGKMTEAWDADACKRAMDYYNQLFGGTIVHRGGYKYQIDMEIKNPQYNFFIRLDTFYSPATPIGNFLDNHYPITTDSNNGSAHLRLKKLIESNLISNEDKIIIENLLKVAYSAGNYLPIPAGGVALNPLRWQEQNDDISKHFDVMENYYRNNLDNSSMIEAVKKYQNFYNNFPDFDAYVEAFKLKPFTKIDTNDIQDVTKAINARCQLLDDDVILKKKIF